MVPKELFLRNFLSYGEGTGSLKLEGVRVAALVGNNGHGKSALLDAITWALFGRARTHNRQLLRQGAKEMEVQLRFAVGRDEYRITRRFSLPNRHTVTLQQFDPQKRRWVVLARDNVREVDRRLYELLKMDYETFVQTVFSPQGGSGSFMRLQPARRRDLLGEILGLDEYEKLAEKAREKERELSGRIQGAEEEMKRAERELEERPKVVAEFEGAVKEKEKREQILGDLERRWKEWQGRRETLLQKRAHLQAAEKQLQDTKDQWEQIQRQLRQDREELWVLRQIIAREKDVLKSYEAYQRYRQEESRLQKLSERVLELEKRRQELIHAIEQERMRLEQEIRVREIERQNAEGRIHELRQALERRWEVEKRLKEFQEAKEELRGWEEKRQRWEEIRGRREGLEQQKSREEAQWDERERQLRQALQNCQRRLALKPRLEREAEELQKALRRIRDWEERAEGARRRQEEAYVRLQKLRARREALEKGLYEVREKLRLLHEHQREPRCPLCESPLSKERMGVLQRKLRGEKDELERESLRLEGDIAATEKALEELQNFLDQAKAEIQKRPELERRAGEIQNDLKRMEEIEEERRRYEGEQETLRRERSERLADYERALKELETQGRALGYDPEKHEELHRRVVHLASVEAEKRQLEKAEAEQKSLAQRVQNLTLQIEAIRHRLRTQDYAHEQRHHLERVLSELQGIRYEPDRHRQVKKWLQENEPKILRWVERLHLARERLPQLERQVTEGERRLEGIRRRADELKEAIEKLRREVESLPEVEKRIGDMERRREGVRRELQEATERVGKLRARLEALNRREQEVKERREAIRGWQEEKEDYAFLAYAFGRYGIPQFILSGAVRWLSEEANQILRRLTGGRMHLRFELTVPTQSGNERETLEIFVGDELGDRPYENYSGGERFRIDLAVRVAMARLLARRSGAALRTLIIDEGFGSQDRQGLEAIVTTIQNIAREFDLVLVVTHLDELRERFPTLIEVTKDPLHGSHYELKFLLQNHPLKEKPLTDVNGGIGRRG